MFGQNTTQGFGQQSNGFGDANDIYDRKKVFGQYNLDPGGNNENGAMLRNISAYNYGPAASRTAFNAGNENNYQNSIRQMLQRLQQRNYAVQGQRAGSSTRAAYGQAQGLADQSARASGLGQGAQLGAQQGLSSQAARMGAAAEESYMDPRRRDADLMQALQMLSQSQGQNPYLDQIMTAFGPIEGRNQANAAAHQNNGLGGILGSLAGQYIGGLGGGMGQSSQGMYGTQAGVRPGSFMGR